jgi:iron complex outermembrane receptor protein
MQGGVRGEWGDGPKAVHYDFAASYASTNGLLHGNDILVDRWALANNGMGGPDCDQQLGTPGVAPCYYWNNFYTGYTSSDPALRNREDVFDWMLGSTSTRYLFEELHLYADFTGATGIELPGGPISYAAGYEYTWGQSGRYPVGQSYTDSPYDEEPFIFLWLVYPIGHPDPVETDSHAAYAELKLPFADTFELGLAARYNNVPWLDEAYTKGRGSVRWTPVPQLVLRGSFSQGLIIPSIWELDYEDRYVVNIPPNFIPIEYVPANQTGGLEAEEADSINLGIIVHPVPQVTLSLDYWQIDFSNPIVRETPGWLLENRPDRVILDPVFGNPVRIIAHRINGPDLETRGYDFSFNWDIASSAGLFSLGFDGALLDRYFFSASEELGTPEYDALGKVNGRYGESPVLIYSTPELKYNLRAGWQKGRHSLNLVYHYIDDYATELSGADRDPETHVPPYNRIDSWGTYDVFYAFRIPSWHTTLRLSVINAADEDPPVMWDELAYDAFTHNPLGRMVKVAVQYQF